MELTKENYHSIEANKEYMSVSQFKNFLVEYGGCPEKELAILKGDYEDSEKECFLEGHYLHSWNEGKLEEFQESHPEIYSSKGKTKGELKSNYKVIAGMIDVLKKDKFVMKLLEGQKEIIFTAEFEKIKWKIMIDVYNLESKYFVDLKGMKDIYQRWWNRTNQSYENFIQHYGYDIQMSVYAEIERLSCKREPSNWLIPHLLLVTKQDVADHEIIYFDYKIIMQKLEYVKLFLPQILKIKQGKIKPPRCNRCHYCRKTKKIIAIKHYKEFDLY